MQRLLISSPPRGKGTIKQGPPNCPAGFRVSDRIDEPIRTNIPIELVEANKETLDPDKAVMDLIGFILPSPLAPRGVHRADKSLRAAGKQLLLSGINVSALPAADAQAACPYHCQAAMRAVTISRMLSRIPQIPPVPYHLLDVSAHPGAGFQAFCPGREQMTAKGFN